MGDQIAENMTELQEKIEARINPSGLGKAYEEVSRS